jgi:hypothetical protein
MFGKTEEKDMNKIVKAVGLIALAAIVVVGMAGCDLGVLQVSGNVVNARAPRAVQYWKGTSNASDSLEGAQITLVDKKANSDNHYEGTVVDGAYSITGISAGKYTLSGVKTGWTFVPREVDITGFLGTLPDLLAYETPSDLSQILIMVEWQNKDMDVDAYVARDTSSDGIANGTIVCGYKSTGTLTIPGGTSLVGTNDYYVSGYGYYYDDPTTPTPGGLVNLERDITLSDPADQPRVETVSVNGATTDLESLRYYIRLYNQTGNNTLTGYPGASSEATVFVMQGTTHLGTYNIAVNSSEYILGVVQMKWTDSDSSWTIGSFSNPIFDSGDNSGLTGVRSLADGVVEVKEIK